MQPAELAERLEGCSIEDSQAPKVSQSTGYDDVLNELREVAIWPSLYAEEGRTLGLRWPTGCLLHGPPGVGKTLLVRTVAAECNATVHEVTSASIVGAYVGESERRLREVFEAAKADAAAGAVCIVFIDEIDALCPKRGDQSGHEARIVAQLLTLMDGAGTQARRGGAGSLAVIAATNRPSAVDPALRRPGRLDREISVPPPSLAQRVAILAQHTRRLPLAPDVHLQAVATRCHGYTGADLAALAREAAMAALTAASATVNFQVDEELLASQSVTWDHFETAFGKVGPSLVRSISVQPDPVRWEDIGGLQEVKLRLQQAVEWPLRHGDAFERLGLEAPRGILLHGPPGCCKTTLARAVATSSRATLLPLSASHLYSMYVGDGEALLQQVFKQARLSAPSIVFLDEVDSLFGKRGADAEESSSASLQLLSTLLTEMDGMQLATGVLVLAATNRPDQLDSALLRPGRFDIVQYVPPPDRDGRLQTMQLYTKEMPCAADVDLAAIADITERFTGAELQHLCDEAALAALRQGDHDVQHSHFLTAAQSMRPALTESVLEQYESWGRQFRR